MCLPKILFPVFMFAVICSPPLIFTWPLTFLIFSPPLWNFHVFLHTKKVRFPSSFSVIHVSINIKNNVEKDTTLFFFSLQKSGRPYDFLPLHLGCHTCWLSYFILVCLWCGRTVGRSLGWCTVTWLPNFLGWVDLLSYAVLHACAKELRYKTASTYVSKMFLRFLNCDFYFVGRM